MDMTLHLTPEMEQGLEREARRLGLPPEEVAARLLQEQLTQSRREAARALLNEWQDEKATPEEMAQSQSDWEALTTALDEDRSSDRKHFPRVP